MPLSVDHCHQPVYCRLTDGFDDSSIDIQFHSSATSSVTSQRHAQLTRWKPVSNIPERWSQEMSDTAAAAAAGMTQTHSDAEQCCYVYQNPSKYF